MNFDPIFEDPAPAEMEGRVARVQEKLLEQKLDWYLSFQPDNIYYLTNFANFVHERPFILLIPARGTPKLVAPKLEISHIRSRAVGTLELVEYFEFPAPKGQGWSDRMKAVLTGAARVGVESVCPLQIYEAVSAERVRSDVIDNLRLIKTPYEIGRMAYAGIVASCAMLNLLDSATIGLSLSEVMSSGKAVMLSRLIADNPSINPLATRADALFQPPRYSDDPHNFTDLAMRMEDGGPHVSLVNAVLNGYGSEIERTFFLGHIPEQAKRPYEVMMKGRDMAFDLAKPGTPMCDVDRAVNVLFRDEGFADNLLHRTGHGMGVTAHEAPFLAEGDPRVLEPGMSLTIEPGIYLAGVGGFRHSDTILITTTGNVTLTDGPISLEELIL